MGTHSWTSRTSCLWMYMVTYYYSNMCLAVSLHVETRYKLQAYVCSTANVGLLITVHRSPMTLDYKL